VKEEFGMKIDKLTLVILLVAASCARSVLAMNPDDPTESQITPPSFAANYQPVFIQDFAAMASLSQAGISGSNNIGNGSWIPDQPNPSVDYGPWAPETGTGATAAPFSLGNGYLAISAQQNNATTLSPYGASYFGGYTTGFLSSTDVNWKGFSQQYGYFEASMETPGGANTWPAFWMVSQPTASGISAEIDPTESYGNYGTGPNQNPPGQPDNTHAGWHLWGYTGGEPTGGGAWAAGFGMTSSFNTYGVDIEPTGITFYYDRQAIWSQTDAQLGAAMVAALAHPMNVMVDLALGGGTYNNPSETAYNWGLTPNPSVLKVQYVAVWASPSSPNYTSTPEPTTLALLGLGFSGMLLVLKKERRSRPSTILAIAGAGKISSVAWATIKGPTRCANICRKGFRQDSDRRAPYRQRSGYGGC
jgi:beta-glucanase (GH16 family)